MHLKTNLELVELLQSLVYAYPELRFSQLLNNFDFVTQAKDVNSGLFWIDEYYLDSNKLADRVKLSIKKLNDNK